MRDFGSLRGIWRSHAYGLLLEIGPERYRLYEETRVSCLPAFEGSLEELAQLYVDLSVSSGRQSFSARRATGVTRIQYRALGALPAPCRGGAFVNPDPEYAFEVLWHTFAERYALFEVRGVDWDAARAAIRARVTPRTTPRSLFRTCTDLLRPLRDGHVGLRSPLGSFHCGVPSALERRVAEALDRPPGSDAVLEHALELCGRLREVVSERYLRGTARSACEGLIEWGRLDEAVGYLGLHAMAGHCGSPDRPRQDQHAAAAAIETALLELGPLPTLVIDLRQNGGGYDGVALRLAGYFVDRRRLAFTKSARTPGGFAGRQSVFVEPRGARRYSGRVLLLTSSLTTSAAEIFVLALLKRPRLTRAGQPTCGEQSDAMERRLPNGWHVTLSNEVYRASDGELYEERGIPPHSLLPFPRLADLERGREPALERALALATGRE